MMFDKITQNTGRNEVGNGDKENDESSVQDSLYSKNGVCDTTGGRAAQRN